MGDIRRIQDIHRRIAILGDVGVGKTSLAQRYTSNAFSDAYDPTIENCFTKVFLHNKLTRLHMEIIDTAGISDYSTNLSRNATVGVHGYLLVFSLYSRASFEKIKVIITLLFNALGDPPSVPIILVGTKCDLKEERAISSEQGRQFASELSVDYIECSAKSGDNVEKLFKDMLNIVDRDFGVATMSRTSSDNHKSCTVM